MVKRLPARQDLTGPRGLVVAIIAQAYMDATSPHARLSIPARQWFKTTQFRAYLDWLDLPATARPQLPKDDRMTNEVGQILVNIVNEVAKRDGVGFNQAYQTLAKERPDVLQTYVDGRRAEDDIARLKKVMK